MDAMLRRNARVQFLRSIVSPNFYYGEAEMFLRRIATLKFFLGEEERKIRYKIECINNMQRRAHIIFNGTVQGVGFRWAVEDIANSLGLHGWVRNVPNGTVEVICEGKKEDIDVLINRIKEEMAHYIRSTEVKWHEPTGEFDGFRIIMFR